MALYDGLGMTGSALPKRANGLLGLLGVQSNPFLDFLGQHSNALVGLGAGIAGGGPDLGQAVGQGLTLAGQGKTADFNRSEKAKADAKLAAQQNYTIDAFKKAGRQDLVDMANSGMMDQAWAKFMKDPIAVGKDTTLLDPNTMKPIFTNTAGDSGAGGPFAGTGMDAQVGNILLTGDPNTADYAYAYSIASQPKITYTQGPDGLVPVTQTPDLSSVRPPTYKWNVPAPAGATAASPAAPMAQAVPAGGDTAPIGAFGGGQGGIQTGTPIPGTQPKLNEQQMRAQSMVRVVAPEVQSLIGDGTKKSPGTIDSLANGWDIAKDATGTAGRVLPFGLGTPSTNYLEAKSSIRTFVASYLYVISGATANPGEVENQAAVLTPQLNDPPEIVAQKRARLTTMLQAMKDAAVGKPVDLNAAFTGPQATGGTGDPELDRALQQYGQ